MPRKKIYFLMLTKKSFPSPSKVPRSRLDQFPIEAQLEATNLHENVITMMNMTEILFYFRYDYACFIWSLNSRITCFPIVCFLVLACFLNLPLTYFRTVLHFYDVFPMHLRQFCNLGTVDPVLAPLLWLIFSHKR